MSMFQPADNLRSRTFLGLLVAQFLAAFNDQAIHASAMFFAIHQEALTKSQAISLMPILFYAPWAIFCTVAGYLADRYSKRSSLVFWKIAEVVICLIALAGFWLGAHGPTTGPWFLSKSAGPWIVLSTVFLMGTHSAFFVPAKYGAMPEILTSRMLSRGNGLLESLSFLAVILGTVVGGILSYYYRGQEEVIGGILLTLALIGACASFFIRKMPAANPTRPFPSLIYLPLVNNLRLLLRSRPLAFAVVGIAFFTFIVAFMRATVYMHGESHLPRWTELKTSVVVGMVALGIGLGSPLVGFLSGGKVEIGLVPVGAIGMILATSFAASLLGYLPGLVACIILIGFFTGFYIVPLFTLLQHRAPKTSKGDSIATSNFINVTGAIAASVLFFGLVWLAHHTTVAPPLEVRSLEVRVEEAGWSEKLPVVGTLAEVEADEHRTRYVAIELSNGMKVELGQRGPEGESWENENWIDVGRKLKPSDRVKVLYYTRLNPAAGRAITYYRVVGEDRVPRLVYEDQHLPSLLFLGAGGMTFVTLLFLWWLVPDLLLRTRLWFRTYPRFRLETGGMHHMPGDGPVVLVTDAPGAERTLHVLSATDRVARFLLVPRPGEPALPFALQAVLRYRHLGVLQEGAASQAWQQVEQKARDALARGEVVGFSLGEGAPPEVEALVASLAADPTRPVILPVHYARQPVPSGREKVYILGGKPLPAGSSVEEARAALRALQEEFQELSRSGVPLEQALAEAH